LPALLLRSGYVARHRLSGRAVDHLDLFRAEVARHDGRKIRVVEERLEDLELVGVHGALHDVLSKTPCPGDQHELVEARLGIDGEHHARGRHVGTHHLLDPDRQGHLKMIEAVEVAIGDRPVGEKRGIAAPAGGHQRLGAHDVQERLLLAGEAGVGQVLGRGRGADGDRQLLLIRAGGHLGIGLPDVGGDLFWKLTGLEGLADRRSGLLQGDAMFVERFHLLADDALQPVGLHEGAIGVRCGGKTAGDLDPLRGEGRDHLAQRGILAPHLGHVLTPQVFEPDEAVAGHDLPLFGHRSVSRHKKANALATTLKRSGRAHLDTGQTGAEENERGSIDLFN
jgi:hypothetical protein